MSVVITGASSGIGRALALALARRGARLVLAARRADRLEALVTELSSTSRVHADRDRPVAVPTDVADESHCRRLVDRAIAQFGGRIDTLVCNAGFGLIRPVWRTSADAMLELFRTNVLGATGCIRRAVPHMLAQERRDGTRGQFVIVSSALARRGLPQLGAYSATKASQLVLAEALRVELRGSGIAVTSVHPILTRTEFFRAAARRSRALPPLRTRGAQSAEHVAARICAAIERPRPEVWPSPAHRWLLSLATIAPRLTDGILWLRQHERTCAFDDPPELETEVELG